MGLFFNLFVESENGVENLNELADYFQSVGRIKTSYGIHEITVFKTRNELGVSVRVHETGHTGLGDNKEKIIATQVGFKFYELLQNAPPFRCAMVGVEADEWFDDQSILDPDFDGYLPDHGLVINDNLNLKLEGDFVNFKEGYKWIPYEGEIKE